VNGCIIALVSLEGAIRNNSPFQGDFLVMWVLKEHLSLARH